MNTHELAWAAGFFDGEGWTANSSDKRRKHPVSIRLGTNQVDRRVLDRFKTAVLGLGKVNGPYNRNRRSDPYNHQPIFTYSVQRWQDVQAVIGLLWKFLSPVKRLQASETLREFHSANITKKIYKVRRSNG